MNMVKTYVNCLVFPVLLWYVSGQEESAEYWNKLAAKEINIFKNIKENKNIAKNVIIFIGDGMGVSTVTAARILKGQQKGLNGEEGLLEFEKFQNQGLIKTYNVDYQVADSAATATAYLGGVKANYGTLGVSAKARRYDCASQKGNEVTSILRWSRDAGKSVGVVTTSRITHASPGAAYAHAADRYWEGDVDFIDNTKAKGCTDIASQLILDNKDIQVIFGGGRRYFLSINSTDPEEKSRAAAEKYQRRDRDLIKTWIDDKKERKLKHKYIWNNEGFDKVSRQNTDYVLGLFAHGHMSYEADRDHGPAGEPHLAQMTKKAIEILSKNKEGFFLFVEAARIDHGHHANNAKRALLDTLALEEAVEMARKITDQSETLMVVSADHSHAFSIAGYPPRGHDILGVAPPYDKDTIPGDKIAYTTLVYANGPGHRNPRVNYTSEETSALNFTQDSLFWLVDETHGGEEVAVYADGPMAHLFRATHEQNYVAHVMAYASCVGAYKDNCDSRERSDPNISTKFQANILVLITFLFLQYLSCN